MKGGSRAPKRPSETRPAWYKWEDKYYLNDGPGVVAGAALDERMLPEAEEWAKSEGWGNYVVFGTPVLTGPDAVKAYMQAVEKWATFDEELRAHRQNKAQKKKKMAMSMGATLREGKQLRRDWKSERTLPPRRHTISNTRKKKLLAQQLAADQAQRR